MLWWLIQPTRHLHIFGELEFEEQGEVELAGQIKAKDREYGIGRDQRGDLLWRGLAHVAYTVGTPEIVSHAKKLGFVGETIGDRLLQHGIVVIQADDDQLNGWARCHSLLQCDSDGTPWLTMDPSCKALIKSIPAGLQDADHTDEIVNASPALTAFRYGAMTRPSPRSVVETVEIPPGSPADVMRRIRARDAGRQFGQAR